MLPNYPLEKNTKIRFYLDFDGTLTSTPGECLFDGYLDQFKQQASTDGVNFQLPERFGVTTEAVTFLIENLYKNNEIVIVSRNRRENIINILLAAGLSVDQISKLKIYDYNDLCLAHYDKGEIIEHHERLALATGEIIICDDDPADACAMLGAVVKFNRFNVSCFSFHSGQFKWQYICSQNPDRAVAFDQAGWLIRQSMSDRSFPFTFAFYFDNKALKKRLTVQDLKKILASKVVNINYQDQQLVKELAGPVRLAFNSQQTIAISTVHQSSTLRLLPSSILKPVNSETNQQIKISSDSVVCCYLDPKVKPQDMISFMEANQSPSIIIYPSDSKGRFLTIDGGQANQSNTVTCYAVSYLTTKDTVYTLKFKTKERDPHLINAELCKKLKLPIIIAGAIPKDEVYSELLSIQSSTNKMCGLIHMHRDKTIRPEEMMAIVHPVMKSCGVLIVSTQTPTESAREGHGELFARGNTGCEIERIFSNASSVLPQKWVIITGHGAAGEGAIVGGYRNLFTPSTDQDISCDDTDYINLLKQCGFVSGDKIHILLYVCESGRSTLSSPSLAEKLALRLAAEGISSYIIASKTSVYRFTGYNSPGEMAGVCMGYNIDGGPNNIVVVTGTPGEVPLIDLQEGAYPNGFFITPESLGGPNQQSQKSSTPTPSQRALND